VILVQVPPIFCAIVAFIYCRLYGAAFAIDTHSSSFISREWRWAQGIHRWLSRRAITTIVHNSDLEAVARTWAIPVCCLGFTPVNYSSGDHYPLKGKNNMVVVSSFDPDEPITVAFDAATQLPDVDFYITGDSNRASPSLIANKPNNCHLTGYISYGQYLSLLHNVDAVIDMTYWDHTVLMGGFEAISVGTPLITSDWPILQNYFHLGTVHVPNTVEGLCGGIRKALREQTTLRRETALMREQLQADWALKFGELRRMLLEPKATI
jgi:glycosyltransferase involved in cell wall biosynthesis